jgi:large subunit ribosomal protein L3
VKIILGKKISMTQKLTEAGVVPVTVVNAGPCTVTQVKGDKDGYQALQLGFVTRRKRKSKPILGHLKGLDNFRYLREFRSKQEAKRGQVCSAKDFKAGDLVSVSGLSKGKGFQGVVKRHGFHGAPKSHGHKDQLRMPGSIGATDAARVFKGTKMAGQMGASRVTAKNLEVVEVDSEKDLLYIKGALPGARNGLLMISGKGDMIFENRPAENKASAVPKPAENAAANKTSVESVIDKVEQRPEEKKDSPPENSSIGENKPVDK